ncbi:g8078 [Coccomyxa elongata]
MENSPLGPDDVRSLYEGLRQALSPDINVQKAAESTLKSLEGRQGFCSCLAEIIGSKDVDHSARWLATIHFKNSINRHWRLRPGQGGISDQEKSHLRTKLLSLIDQEDNQIAVQVAVVFAKVARIDYPRQWQSVFADLIALMQSGRTLTVRRVYLVLHHILKELSSKRLTSDQKNFADVTKLLYDSYWNQWLADTTTLLQVLPEAVNSSEQNASVVLTFERWLLVLKGLRRLILFGFQSDAKSLQVVPAVTQVVPAFLKCLQNLLPLRYENSGRRSQLQAMVDRAILKLTKIFTNLLETHPWSLLHCPVFSPLLEFLWGQIVGAPSAAELYESFYRQCMLFLHGVLKSPAYGGSSSSSLELNLAPRSQAAALKSMSAEAKANLQAFWAGSRQHLLCVSIVEKFLPLNAKELQEWSESSAAFHHEADVGSWQDHLRGCAEVLLVSLLEEDRQSLAPIMVQLLQNTSEACPPGSCQMQPGPRVRDIPAAVLAKEAAYNAVGVGAYELHDYIDFGSWFNTALLQELADTSPEAKPLRRRAALLVGQWVVKLPADTRPAAYRALLSLMADEDTALQLAAVSSLRALVEDWEFQEAPFLEFVAPALQLLAALLQESTELDTQLQVFHVFNMIIERLADGVRPFAEGILQLLPSVWQRAEGQSLLRIQVLLSMQRLINALGTASPSCYPVLIPMVQVCTDPNQPDELNLLEDGLQLWLIALRNAPEPQPELLNIFPNLAVVMERSTEHIQTAIQIITSCVLLGGPSFMDKHAATIVGILCTLLGNVKERGMLLLLPVMALLLCAYPEQVPGVMEPALQKLLQLLLSDQEPSQVLAGGLGVFARLLLQSSSAFMQVLARAEPHLALPAVSAGSQPGVSALLALLDLWLDKFDNIGMPHARKLSALAMCVLLTVPLPAILERLEPIAGCITSVWFEVEGSDLAGHIRSGSDYFSPIQGDAADTVVSSEDAEGESSRRQELYDRDPVNHIKLSEFLRTQLASCAAVHGAAFQTAFSRLPATLAEQLKAAVGENT